MAPRLLIVEENAELASLVAAAAARLGVEAILCATGREALTRLREVQPGAAVVDLPVADVRGSEVLSALKRAGVKVVAVSGVFRGRRCAREVARLGADAFFEKPFAVEELLDALAPLLGVKPAREPGQVRDEVTDAEPVEEEDEALEPAPGKGRRRRREAPPPQGDLATTRVPRLLAACYTAQVTGALTLQRGRVKRLVLFRQGVPVFASSNLAADRFGALCVRRGVLTQAQREDLRREIGPEARTAEALLRKGIITERRRTELVAEQVRSIVWSTFPWRDGAYRLEVKPLPPRELVQLSLFPGDLILEGVLRTATLEELRRDLPAEVALAPAPDPAFELYALGLRPAEAHLLAAADGTKTTADLLRLTDLPEREAMAFLQACRLMGVLDDVERVLAGTRRMAFM
ncbi:MAG TPA: response regulator [Anaeromyxobacteraceae bacterium]|nr:response regulator [Anaeromyxobacteraceae bacterium]